MPDIDQNLGFYQVAKFNYFPGWHQQVSCLELLVNKEKFEALPDSYQAMVEMAVGREVAYTYADTEAKNPAAMNAMKSEFGVTNKRWSDADLAKLEAAWNEVMAEESEKDPLFKAAAESYSAWRAAYKTWGDAQALDSTYLE